ncbi:MAG: AAA family ATPase [Candidatus Asgardarchaeum sp.]
MKLSEDIDYKITVKRIWVKNFKSLRDFKLDLRKINIVVGKNGSGKTNLIEVFQLFKEILDFLFDKEVNPFLKWWSYANVVWNGNENLPITVGIEYDVIIPECFFRGRNDTKKPTTAKYEITVTGVGGEFNILEDRISIPKIIDIKNNRNSIIIQFDTNLIKKILSEEISFENAYSFFIGSLVQMIYDKVKDQISLDEVKDRLNQELKILKMKCLNYLERLKVPLKVKNYPGTLLLEDVVDEIRTSVDMDNALELVHDIISEKLHFCLTRFLIEVIEEIAKQEKLELINIFFEHLGKMKNTEKYYIIDRSEIIKIIFPEILYFANQISEALIGVYLIISRSVILKKIDFKSIKEPVKLRKELVLSEDGSNLVSVLYSLGKGKTPKRVKVAIEYAFGEQCNVLIEPTSDGRIYLKFQENGKEWSPPSIPDGLYKLIALELALEYKAPIIAVDEIENSLYADIIRYFIDEVRNSSSIAILTTHSPAVMDFSDPEDIVIFKKDIDKETKPYRLKKPKKIQEMLREEGITLSEYILYREISDET